MPKIPESLDVKYCSTVRAVQLVNDKLKCDPDLTKALRSLLGPPKHECVACGDTGVSSRGGPCVPCQTKGRIKEVPRADTD